MEPLLTACFLSLACTWAVSALAQCRGLDGGPNTVKELHWTLDDEVLVSFSGNIVCHVGGGLYEFTDGTGTVYLEMNSRELDGLSGRDGQDGKVPVNVYGRYVHKLFGRSRIEVIELSPADVWARRDSWSMS
jgi:uncharacterized protein (TIGR00156 family)